MMRLDFLKGYGLFAGVPDSQLKPLCDYLTQTFGISSRHIIAANEGNCAAIAAGYHLATGKVPVVYLQNSGIGNIINPVTSLLNENVYGIPCIFIIGWRGEPGVKDEPQHIFQGQITIKLLENVGIRTFVIGEETTDQEVYEQMNVFRPLLDSGKSVAFVVRKGAFSYDGKVDYQNDYVMRREEIIRHIVDVTGKDVVVSTTGKASRELFEIREENKQTHAYDFLTVGSMGHCSSIAMGIALSKPNTKVWCIDGDGAALMHMGAMAVLGTSQLKNIVHIVINNGAHDTVGGMPTVARKVDLVQIAKGCGYSCAVCADTYEELDCYLKMAKERAELQFIEVKAAIGTRENLGRPTSSPIENKNSFMRYLSECE